MLGGGGSARARDCGNSREMAGIMRQKLFKQMPVIIGESSDFLPSFLAGVSPLSSLRRGRRRLLSTELRQLSEHCTTLRLVEMKRGEEGGGGLAEEEEEKEERADRLPL